MSLEKNITNIKDNSIVFCSFDSNSIAVINNLIECEPKGFKIHNSNLSNNETTKDDYLDSFQTCLNKIKTNKLKKIVLSRIKEENYTKDPIEIFKSLNNQHTSTFNYIFSSSVFGCWMGATPEILLSKTADQLETVSLAGTILQSESWTLKEKEEQQFVTDYIVTTFEKNDLKVVTNGPADQNNGIVKHLKTSISSTSNSEHDFGTILNQLHPTPATCGIPTKESKDLIIETELHNRKFYTGYILLNKPNPVAYVNLRCMEIGKRTAQLYLGGGLTSMSEAEKEWEETERKAQTLLKAFK